MCGFAGYLIFNNKPEADSRNLAKMMNLQKHRGPDDSGLVGIQMRSGWYSEIMGLQEVPFKAEVDLLLGFNRLSILDLSPNGHQPMFNQSKFLVLMMNGEVYNAFDYKKELEEKAADINCKIEIRTLPLDDIYKIIVEQEAGVNG